MYIPHLIAQIYPMTGNFIKTCFIPFNSLQDVAGVKFHALTVNASINWTNVMVETTVEIIATK